MDSELKKIIDGNIDHLETIERLLSEPLSHSPETLKDQISTIRGHAPYLSELAVKLHSLVYKARKFFLPIKSRDITDLDREIILKEKVSEFEYWYQRVNNLLDIMASNSNIAQSFLSYEKEHMRNIGREEFK